MYLLGVDRLHTGRAVLPFPLSIDRLSCKSHSFPFDSDAGRDGREPWGAREKGALSAILISVMSSIIY